MRDSPSDRAARGAAALDVRDPTWADQGRIDLRTLDVDDGRKCPLGQLAGSYILGCKKLITEFGASGMYRLGFTVLPSEIKDLNNAWKAEIKKRRAR